ncbi:putative oxidoreductase [Chryseobacterium sp. H1D6B]|uniref:HvfX family Cu-binding RiPP maturation protein n=1 Tax=Chryseobacterium sp. H1D6B TaxID=2940588 RepID=UPI0015CCE3F5|nr:DoxX family protein [Chryseobacterium sp. H1D6B]MDH6253817.1 putative oxidoreductase [Chryseobacterium sp. H1D6B]
MIKKKNILADRLKDLPLLFIRLILAYGFFNPALMKLKDIHGIADWFESIGIPFPLFNAYLTAVTEILGVILLMLGLFSRFISIPLLITMIVAVITVHGTNGFEAGENGFEIPLYYMIMLFTLVVYGSGKISLDYLLFDYKCKTESCKVKKN